MNGKQITAVLAAVLVLLAGAPLASMAWGSGGVSDSATPTQENVTLENVQVDSLELANVTIENATIEELSVDEVQVNGETKRSGTFRNVSLSNLVLANVSLSDVESSNQAVTNVLFGGGGAMTSEEMATEATEEGEGTEMATETTEGASMGAGVQETTEATEEETTETGGEETTEMATETESGSAEGRTIVIQNLVIERMSVESLTVEELTVAGSGGMSTEMTSTEEETEMATEEGTEMATEEGTEMATETTEGASMGAGAQETTEETTEATEEETTEMGGEETTGMETTSGNARTIDMLTIGELQVNDLTIQSMTVEEVENGSDSGASTETTTEQSSEETEMATETTESASMGSGVQQDGLRVETMSIGTMTVEQASADSVAGERGSVGLSVTNASLPSNVTLGENYTVTATIANNGSERKVEQVQYRIGGSVVKSQLVEVEAGNQSEVTFEINTSGFSYPPGQYEHGVYTASGSQVGNISFNEEEMGGGNVTTEAATTEAETTEA